jgi:hypothetical protein
MIGRVSYLGSKPPEALLSLGLLTNKEISLDLRFTLHFCPQRPFDMAAWRGFSEAEETPYAWTCGSNTKIAHQEPIDFGGFGEVHQVIFRHEYRYTNH